MEGDIANVGIVALSGTVFIDRSNRKSAIAAFDSAIREIRGNKQSVWIFPVSLFHGSA